MEHIFRIMFIFIIIKPLPCFSTFSVGTTDNLPYATFKMAVGYDEANKSTLIVGGYSQYDFITFDGTAFIDKGLNYLFPVSIFGQNQYFTQISNKIWTVRDDGAGFITFDTTTYETEDPQITIETNVDSFACLTSTSNHLFVLGGGGLHHELDTVQIYDLNDNQWISAVPSLNKRRHLLACAVVTDTLYAVGGYNSNEGYFNTIEILDVSDITTISTNIWSYFSGTLQEARDSLTATVYGEKIYVVGGWSLTSYSEKYVDIIDTSAGVCFAGEDLYYPVSRAPSIIVANTLYVFGGFIRIIGVATVLMEDRYQYLQLPTINPSVQPTNQPTEKITVDPTKYPTRETSINPTNSTERAPTAAPSESPSQEPTIAPTDDPLIVPETTMSLTTYNPTLLPTLNHVFTQTSTQVPSVAPSITLNDGEVKEVISTAVRMYASSDEREAVETNTDLILMSSTLLSGGICICCAVLLVVFCCKRNRNTKIIQSIRNNMHAETEAGNDPKCGTNNAVYLDNCEDKSGVNMVSMNCTEEQKGEDNMMRNLNAEIASAIVTAFDADNDDAEILEAAAPTDFGGISGDDDEGHNEEHDAEVVNETVGRNDDMNIYALSDDEFVIKDDSDDNENIVTVGATAKYGDSNGNDVKLWLNSIKCGQYFDTFIKNGFRSMDSVKQINDVKDLDAIGIALRGHQLKILNNIKKLKK